MFIENKYFVAFDAKTKKIVSPEDYRHLQTSVNIYPSKDITVEVFDDVFEVVNFVNENNLVYETTGEN